MPNNNISTADALTSNNDPLDNLFVHVEPISCFPDVMESSPKNFILCLLYFLGTGAAAATAIFLYLRERRRNENESYIQNSSKPPGN